MSFKKNYFVECCNETLRLFTDLKTFSFYNHELCLAQMSSLTIMSGGASYSHWTQK